MSKFISNITIHNISKYNASNSSSSSNNNNFNNDDEDINDYNNQFVDDDDDIDSVSDDDLLINEKKEQMLPFALRNRHKSGDKITLQQPPPRPPLPLLSSLSPLSLTTRTKNGPIAYFPGKNGQMFEFRLMDLINCDEIKQFANNYSRLWRSNVPNIHGLPRNMPQLIYQDLYNYRVPLPNWLTNDIGVKRSELREFHNTFTFGEKETGLDTFWQRAFSYKLTLAWVLLTINYLEWIPFTKFVYKYRSYLYILPYSCLCNLNTQLHRHVLMVCIKENYNMLYDQLKFLHYLTMEDITTNDPLNLIRIIKNVSTESTTTSNDPINKIGSTTNTINTCNGHHYYFFKPVVANCELFMMLYVKNGLNLYFANK